VELAVAIGRVFGRTPQIAFGEARVGDIRESLGNPAAAERALGFSAKISIEEGLGLMAAYEAK
jgi:nucleoside-diphosphate-sugar epimerase